VPTEKQVVSKNILEMSLQHRLSKKSTQHITAMAEKCLHEDSDEPTQIPFQEHKTIAGFCSSFIYISILNPF
jgi:hypothetical protein